MLKYYEINSGSKLELEIKTFDENNKTFTIDSSTSIKIKFFDDEIPDEYGKVQSNIKLASRGVYKFNELVIIQKPDTVALMELEFGNFEQYQVDSRQNTDFLSKDPTQKKRQIIVIKTRACMLGEQYTEERTCKACPKSYSTYEP